MRITRELAWLIAKNDIGAIIRLKQEYISNNSLKSWVNLYRRAKGLANTKPYQFKEF